MKIDVNGIGDLFDNPQPVRINSSRPVKSLSNTGADASLRIMYASLIDRAKHARRPESDALEQGRRLLLSGKLDSPEIIRAAAENIAKSGI